MSRQRTRPTPEEELETWVAKREVLLTRLVGIQTRILRLRRTVNRRRERFYAAIEKANS